MAAAFSNIHHIQHNHCLRVCSQLCNRKSRAYTLSSTFQGAFLEIHHSPSCHRADACAGTQLIYFVLLQPCYRSEVIKQYV